MYLRLVKIDGGTCVKWNLFKFVIATKMCRKYTRVSFLLLILHCICFMHNIGKHYIVEYHQLRINDFPIANVQCQYDLPDDRPDHTTDHTYDTRDEPPAFIIHQVSAPQLQTSAAPFVEVSPSSKVMTFAQGNYGPSVNVIHVGENRPQPNQTEYININKRIRRSEVLLRQAADCVSRGLTFQTVSHQFNIPISTIRFFMARKGILPQRRRGRSTMAPRPCSSPEPPFHMQHYKLPDMVALRDSEQDSNE